MDDSKIEEVIGRFNKWLKTTNRSTPKSIIISYQHPWFQWLDNTCESYVISEGLTCFELTRPKGNT